MGCAKSKNSLRPFMPSSKGILYSGMNADSAHPVFADPNSPDYYKSNVPEIRQIGQPSATPSALKEEKINQISFVPENKNRIANVYKFESEPIGTGSFGEVRRGTHLQNGAVRAIKIIYKHKVEKSYLSKVMQEIFIMIQLDHPNVVKIYEYFIDEKFLYIVMEMVNGGELFDKIQEKKKFTEIEASEIFFQLLSAINYLHKHNIVHRDIKPENILLDGKNLKLIDFGTSREYSRDAGTMNKLEGTPYYIAPEVLEGEYTEKCDEWSAGVILYILLTGKPPFNGVTDEDIFAEVRKAKPPMNTPQMDTISSDAKDLIRRLLTKDYRLRYTAGEALEHRWFMKFHKPSVPIKGLLLDRIRDFNTKNKFQQSIYYFLVNHLASKEEKEELTKIFRQIDKNSDGVLSHEELMSAYRGSQTALTEQDVNELFERLDSNGSNTIEYTEFIAAALDKRKLLTQQRIEQCFKMFDKNGDNRISVNELASIFEGRQSFDREFWENMIKEVDKNNNGEVDFEEFKEILNKMA